MTRAGSPRLARPALGRTAEDGAVMILALLLMLVIGTTVGALATLTQTNLVATRSLQHQRDYEYAADAAVDGSIQEVRYLAPPKEISCPISTPSALPFNMATTEVNSVPLVVEYCVGVPGAGFYGRVAEFDACPVAAGSTTYPSWTTCQGEAVLRASVVYNDVKQGCTSGANPGCYGSSWGQGGVTVEDWTVLTTNG